MLTPKFAHGKPSFHTVLKNRINEYFETSGKDESGGGRLFWKAVFLLCASIYVYVQLVFFTPGVLISILLCVLLGVLTAAIGFNIMHDGGHGSFSKYKWINKAAAATAEFVGASHFMWHTKHNIIHHTYTNIDGIDDDIDAKPFLRMAASQKRYKIHRYQHWYFWFFYAMLHLYWTTASDFKKYFSRKVGELPLKKMTVKDHIFFWLYKIIYYGLFIVVPIVKLGVIDWLIGFSIFTCVTGFILSIVFQLAHTVEHTAFPEADDQNKMSDEWAIHQLKTTANFATKNKAISWFVGGLNFQVEHHLFPKISHIHYPEISKIIRETCAEFNVVYIEYKRLYQAVFSHIAFLKQMGKAV